MCGHVLMKCRDFGGETAKRRRDSIELDLFNLGFGI